MEIQQEQTLPVLLQKKYQFHIKLYLDVYILYSIYFVYKSYILHI